MKVARLAFGTGCLATFFLHTQSDRGPGDGPLLFSGTGRAKRSSV